MGSLKEINDIIEILAKNSERERQEQKRKNKEYDENWQRVREGKAVYRNGDFIDIEQVRAEYYECNNISHDNVVYLSNYR